MISVLTLWHRIGLFWCDWNGSIASSSSSSRACKIMFAFWGGCCCCWCRSRCQWHSLTAVGMTPGLAMWCEFQICIIQWICKTGWWHLSPCGWRPINFFGIHHPRFLQIFGLLRVTENQKNGYVSQIFILWLNNWPAFSLYWLEMMAWGPGSGFEKFQARPKAEVFTMPHRFLLDSSHSSGIWWNPEELKMAEGQPTLPFQGSHIPEE